MILFHSELDVGVFAAASGQLGRHLTYRPRRSHECSDHDATLPRCTQSLSFSWSYAAVRDLEPTSESTVRVRSAVNRWPYHHGVAAGQCGWRYRSLLQGCMIAP